MTRLGDEQPPAIVEALASCEVIDLTLTLAEDMPCAWPTHMLFQHKVYNWYAERPDVQRVSARLGPYHTRWLTIDEHTGTHFDAPVHFIPPPDSGLPWAGPAGELFSHKVDVRQLMGPAVVIDVTRLSGRGTDGVSPLITAAMVQEWEQEHGEIQPEDVVIFYSGWDRLYRSGPEGEAYCFAPFVLRQGPGWPSPDAECVTYLADRGVRLIATDGPSVGSSHDGAPPHRAGLSRSLVYVEGLCRLDELPTRGAFFVFLPIKVRNGTGGPGRAIAFVSSPRASSAPDDRQ